MIPLDKHPGLLGGQYRLCVALILSLVTFERTVQNFFLGTDAMKINREILNIQKNRAKQEQVYDRASLQGCVWRLISDSII